MTAPKWMTGAGFLGTYTERITTSTSIVADGVDVAYRLISGSLPGGLRLSNTGIISGTPYSVGDVIRSDFVIRASNTYGVTDRRFLIDVSGPTDPEWLTPSGLLPIGFSNQYYAINRQAVDYQLTAEYDKLPPGQQLRYFIQDGEGTLPPGLSLTESGRILGQIKDKLKLSYKVANQAGYDEESYDEFPYDHALIVGTQIGTTAKYISKTYQFYVTATDGVAYSKRLFRIKVEDPTSLRVDNSYLDVDSTFYSVDSNYLLTPQWLSPSNLGIIRANNRQVIKLDTYDFNPNVGPVTYNVIGEKVWKYLGDYSVGDFVLYSATGNPPYKTYVCKQSHIAEATFDITKWTLNELPPNFNIEPTTGVMYAVLPYQPAYSRTYTFSAYLKKVDDQTNNSVTAAKTFTITIRGDVETVIQFTTDSHVGSLTPGAQSELFVNATHVGDNYKIRYTLIAGALPAGLSLLSDGSISGKIEYNTQTYFDRAEYGYKSFILDGGTTTIDKRWHFTVQASDIFDQSSVEKEFYINVDEVDIIQYTNIYAQAMLPRALREKFREFVSDRYTFPDSMIYRLDDPVFGRQEKIKLPLQYGIEKVSLSVYIDQLRKYFYRKKFNFGSVKFIKAEDSNGNYVYDFVYVEIAENTAIVGSVDFDNKTVYPNHIGNMQDALETVKVQGETIKTDEYLRPRFMSTIQPDTGSPLGFIFAVPICYALPGMGDVVVKRIKLANFDFKDINFEIDRLVVEDSVGNDGAKYLLFPRKEIVGTNLGESLSYIVGPNETELLTEEGDPIFLE
jgi:hypothetical protein